MERLRALPERVACELLGDERGPMSRQYLWQIRTGRSRMSLRMFTRVVCRLDIPPEVAIDHLRKLFPEEETRRP